MVRHRAVDGHRTSLRRHQLGTPGPLAGAVRVAQPVPEHLTGVAVALAVQLVRRVEQYGLDQFAGAVEQRAVVEVGGADLRDGVHQPQTLEQVLALVDRYGGSEPHNQGHRVTGRHEAMMARSPRDRLTDRLADPGTAFSFPPATATRQSTPPNAEFVEDAERTRATDLFRASDWADLGHHYDRIAERAWRTNRPAEALRLLLAARAAAQRAGDTGALLERTRFLAERHRLSTAFLAAEAWNLEQLGTEPTPVNAPYHVSAWRARAELCEPSGAYESAVAFSDRALAVAERFAGAPGVAEARARALLQRGNTERLRGHLETAYSYLRDAREEAERLTGEKASPHLRGLIARIHARMDVTVGHFESALAMYLEAEDCFRESGSGVNVRVVRLARVSALRSLGRLPDALALCRELVRECEELGLDRIRGQLLLEQAEVLEAMGDGEETARTLELARRHHEGARTLEAARWNRHMGRRLIMSKGDMKAAAAHLTASLGIATREEGPDLTRTWYALHDLLRLEGDAELPESLRLSASRTALAGADLQRDRLSRPENRWALHEQRE
ncbi:tetratricopeptide repeat protein, partial [Streptomyces sp. NPDC002920]